MRINNLKLFIVAAWAAVGLASAVSWLVVDALHPKYPAMSGSIVDLEPPTLVDRVHDALVVLSELGRDPLAIGFLVGSAAVGAGFGLLHATHGEQQQRCSRPTT
jgi:hypothetical protein